MEATVAVMALSFAFNLIVVVATISAKFGGLEGRIAQRINEHRDEMEERRERDLRNIGEALTGLRAKITEVELFNRDTFARRDGVFQVVARVEGQLSAIDRTMNDHFKALADKLDRKIP